MDMDKETLIDLVKQGVENSTHIKDMKVQLNDIHIVLYRNGLVNTVRGHDERIKSLEKSGEGKAFTWRSAIAQSVGSMLGALAGFLLGLWSGKH